MKNENEVELCRELGFKIKKVERLMHRQMEQSETKQYLDSITGTHGYIICYLDRNSDHDVYQKDIEQRFSIRRSTVTEVLQRMEKNGLITRLSVSSDARLKKIVLTEKAKDIIKYLDRDIEKTHKNLVKGFSVDELNVLVSLLQRVEDNLTNVN